MCIRDRCEALALQFELDFSLIACLVSSAMGSVWYLDSGASFHMTRDKELFSDLEEKDLQIHIEMGNDGRYSVNDIGTITFERELGKPFLLKDVMHVPGLKKNLVSVAMLEDRVMMLFSTMEKISCDIKQRVKPRGYGFESRNSTRWR